MLGIPDEVKRPGSKRKNKSVTFNDDEEIINPEDVDPSVGRFRNLVQTTVIPSSKVRFEPCWNYVYLTQSITNVVCLSILES